MSSTRSQAALDGSRSDEEAGEQGMDSLDPSSHPPPLPEPTAADLLGALPSLGSEDEPPVSPVAAFEKELRDRLSSGASPKGAARRKYGKFALVAGVLGVLVAFALQRQDGREELRLEEASRFIAAARNGLSRDTRSAYNASVDALEAALAMSPDRGDAKAMLAQALATLSLDYGSGERDLERALELLEAADPSHESAMETRWRLTSGTDEGKVPLEEEILQAAEKGGPPPIQSLAGEILLGRGESAKAIERFNLAMQGMPGHVPTLVRIGDSYLARKEVAEAGRYYDLALAVAEEHVGALLGAAESRLAARRAPKALLGALADLQRIRGEAHVPMHLREKRHILEARLHLALGDRSSALAALGRLPQGLPRPELAKQLVDTLIQAGAPDRASALFDSFLGTKDSDPLLREAWVRALLAKEEYRKATSVPAAAGEREIRVLQGVAWFRMGQLGQAKTLLRSATLAGKLPVDAIVYLAWIDWNEGKTARARKNLERFGIGAKARTSGSWAYASILRAEGKWDLAEEILAKALERAPHSADLHHEMGRLKLERDDRDQARGSWLEALSLNPFHSGARAALARLQLEAGALDEAEVNLQRLLDQRPESGEALGGLALVYLQRGERERALRLAESAMQAAPRSAAPLQARAAIHIEEGELARAERLLGQAASMDPSDPDLWWALGELRLALDDGKGAGIAFLRGGQARVGWIAAKVGRARALTAQGRGILAATQLRALVEEGKQSGKKDRALTHAALGEAILSQGKGFATTARREAELAVELDGDLPLAHLIVAMACDALGDPAAAAPHHERLVELAPRWPKVFLARGRHMRDQRDPEEAAEAFERYLELLPRGEGVKEARRELAALRR